MITHVPTATGGTGMSRYSTELLNRLDTGPDGNHTVHDTKIHEINIMGRKMGGMITRWWKGIFERVEDNPIVHAHSPMLLHRQANVCTVHDLDAFLNPSEYGLSGKVFRLMRSRFDNLDRIITPTVHVARQARRFFDIDHDRVHATPLGIDHGPWGLPDDPSTREGVLFVGDVRPRKRVASIVQACGELDVPLHRVGPPMDQINQPYHEHVHRLANKHNVAFLDHGFVTLEELARLYRSCRVLAFPSRSEGFGLPVLEAAANGLTSVVSTCPVFDDTIGDLAHRWEPGTRLADTIQDAMDQPKDPSQLAKHARSFTWAYCAQATVDVYQEAVA